MIGQPPAWPTGTAVHVIRGLWHGQIGLVDQLNESLGRGSALVIKVAEPAEESKARFLPRSRLIVVFMADLERQTD